MKTLAAQFLVSLIVFLGLAFSQEDGEGRGFPKYAVVNKQINIREIIRFGGRRGEGQDDTANFEVPEDNDYSWTSLSSLLTKASNAASLRKMKTMLPLSGLRWLDQTDNDPGRAVVCGRWTILLLISFILKTMYFYFAQNSFSTLFQNVYERKSLFSSVIRSLCGVNFVQTILKRMKFSKIQLELLQSNVWKKRMRKFYAIFKPDFAFVGPKGAHFNITWEPKVVDSHKSIKVNFDITNRKISLMYAFHLVKLYVFKIWISITFFFLLTAIDFDKGRAHLELYQKGSSDPMFSFDQDMSCSQIAQLAPFVKCPLKKGGM